MQYIHIPKTAGTALRNVQKINNIQLFPVCQSHKTSLRDLDKAVFGVRDPLDRFISGFWEAKSFRTRHNLLELEENQKYSFGDYSAIFYILPRSENLLKDNNIQTPDQFITYIRNSDLKDYELDLSRLIDSCPLRATSVASVTTWLGDFEEYKQLEDRVRYALDVDNLTKVMKEFFGVDMLKNPIANRETSLYYPEAEGNNEISEDNLHWFKEWRDEDYKLIDYIKSRPYYLTEYE